MSNAATRPAIVAALAELTDDTLLRFLAGQRWFAAKGTPPTSGRVTDVVVLPWSTGAYAIARVDVEAGGATRTYQLAVAARDPIPPAIPPHAVITPGLYDAVYDDDFRRGLAAALATGASATSGDLTWIAEPLARIQLTGEGMVGSAEQSNTSVIFDSIAILKLFRTLEPGIHPDVELTEFLTKRAGFTNTPELLATLRLEQNGERTTVGMLQTYLPNASDAWSYALECGRSYFDAPGDRDAPNNFVAAARRLGAITRAMHDALASDDEDPAFAPEPVVPEDVDRWAHRTQQAIRDSLALLERHVAVKDFPNDRLPEAQALIGRRDHFLGWINEIDDSLGDDLGMRIRVHGDYHLGQLLRVASGDFMVIDFEGEPSRPIEERREKTSPLRDVAGMLRSFAYAAATLATSAGNIDPRTKEIRTARWEREVRHAYLAAYLAFPDDEEAGALPEEEQHARQLIALFEAEKAFYELAYELNNRPSWVWIPMRGISKLFVAPAGG